MNVYNLSKEKKKGNKLTSGSIAAALGKKKVGERVWKLI